MTRVCRLLICVMPLLVASGVWGDPPDEPSGKATTQKKSASRKKSGSAQRSSKPEKRDGDKTENTKAKVKKNVAINALRMVLKKVELADMTFEEFAEWLGRATKANVVVRWKVIEAAGVGRDYSITYKGDTLRVKDLLSQIFLKISQEHNGVELAVLADDNTFIISTREDFARERFILTYDVQDLVMTIPNFSSEFRSARFIDAGDRIQAASMSGGVDTAELRDAVKDLIDLITTHVEPKSWKVNGGKGTIRYLQGKLIVNNNLEVHQMLGGSVKRSVVTP